MATALPAPIVAKALPGSRFDHLFFSAASVLVLISVLIGFAPTCFLVGVFRATFQIPLFISTAPYIPAGSFSWFSKLVWSPLIASTSIAASGCSASPCLPYGDFGRMMATRSQVDRYRVETCRLS